MDANVSRLLLSERPKLLTTAINAPLHLELISLRFKALCTHQRYLNPLTIKSVVPQSCPVKLITTIVVSPAHSRELHDPIYKDSFYEAEGYSITSEPESLPCVVTT